MAGRVALNVPSGGFQQGIDSCVGFDVDPISVFDTILLHNIAFPEYKHDLSFVTSVWGEPGRAWKTDREGRKNALEAETDQELHRYCAFDVRATHSLVEPLLNLIYEREQQHIIPLAHTVQRICGEMHANGMWVDQAKRKEVERLCIQKLNHGYKAKNKQTGEIEWVPGYLQQLRQLSGKPDLNPGSTAQLRTVLFEDGWRLEPPFSEDDEEMAYTESGDRSTSDVVIRALLKLETNGQLLPHQALFLKVLRTYRSEQKMLGTYIAKLRSADEVVDVGWDDDDDENERAYREEKNLSKRGVVWPDGRMRPGYNAHVALTGRLSSSKPMNAQNFPKPLRTLIRAGPGHILIGADADQIEFRIGAAWWGVTKYLKAFEAGADPHSTTALACFGDAFLKADGFPGGHWEDGLFFPNGEGDWTGPAYDQRTLGKRIQFNGQYKGSPETMCRVIQEGENDAGELIYLGMTEDRVRYLYQNWKAGIPEMERGWNRDIAFFRKHKFIADPVIGRRRYCPNGENPNEIVNFPVQGAAAALVNRAMIKLARLVPFERWGPGTGLIGQVHDWLGLEVPDTGVTVEEKLNKKGKKVFVYHVAPRTPAAEAMEAMNEVMNFTEPSLPGVRFTSGAKIGYTWKEVG